MMWGYDGTWSWGGMFLMGISMIFWVAVLGALLFWALRWLSPRSGSMIGTSTHLSGRQLLEQRYARGEIDEATFQRMRDQLNPPPTA